MIPRGIRNNNPLNIRHNRANRWQGVMIEQPDPQFVRFASIQFGLRAGFVILRNYIKEGYDTPAEIIGRWAPPCENNTQAYINSVCNLARLHQDQVLTFDDKARMCKLVQAMAKVECGRLIDINYVIQGYDMV